MTIRSGARFVGAGKRLKKLRPKVRLSSKAYDTLEKREKAIKKSGDYAGVILFSGGMDSVAVAMHLAKRKKKYLPVYLSHRSNVGNVTKKEIVAARKLAKKILGEELMVFKKGAKSGKIPEWYGKKVRLTDTMPVPKQRKNTRNRKFLEVLKEAGLADKEIWLGVLGTGSDPSSRASSAGRAQDVTKQGLQKHLKKIGAKGRIRVVKDLPGVKTKVHLIKKLASKKNLFQSQSCLMYFGRHCGDCWSCVERAEAFMQAFGEDKTAYRQSSKAHHIVKGR
jgi:7-cyano-7-deazaguanine synthase in queuosine biosynthesis